LREIKGAGESKGAEKVAVDLSRIVEEVAIEEYMQRDGGKMKRGMK
jgi:hypothetical protein